MLNSHVNSLGDDSVSHLLVDDDTDGSGVDVEDGPRSAVVVLVRHSLVNGAIDNDIDDISVFIGGKSLSNVDRAVLFETLSELVSSSSLISVAVSHGNYLLFN
jgi:hypothetical protein